MRFLLLLASLKRLFADTIVKGDSWSTVLLGNVAVPQGELIRTSTIINKVEFHVVCPAKIFKGNANTNIQ